ncbi:MAG: ABC transporter permease [Spirochaetaceae bacterium]|nr:ABC transporter permease [Spirochaetaceae bacterium]
MGKTYRTTIFREIRGSLGRFVAIFAIVALGVGFMAGLLATTPDMKISMDRYFDQTNMMDIFIKGTLGLTPADADALRASPEVALVLPAYVTDAVIETSSAENLVAKIYGLPLNRISEKDFVNRPELLEGRLPAEDAECLALQGGGNFAEIPVGAVVAISEENIAFGALKSLSEAYKITRFTVTGVVKSPLYISTDREPSGIGNGQVGAVLFVPETAYALPAYTDFYVTLKNTGPLTGFMQAYQNAVAIARTGIEALGIERSRVRRNEIIASAGGLTETALAQAEAEYAASLKTAELELSAARKKLDAGAEELAAGEAELSAAATRLEEGRAAFAAKRAEAERTFAENEEALRRGEQEIAEAKRTLSAAKNQLDALEPQIEKARKMWFQTPKIREGIAQYDEGRSAYNAGILTVRIKDRELQQGRLALETGRDQATAEFAKAEADLAAGTAEIEAGRRKLGEARTQLIAGEAEYKAQREKALAGLQDGGTQLALARRSLTDGSIPTPQWYVLDRNANAGCRYYKSNVEKIADVAKAFPVFFLLIAGLVALTTMTRMVEEERTQIGVLKALGYQKRTILSKYLIYCGLTGVLGSAAGMISGFQGLPIIIYRAFATMYRLPPLVTEFNWTFGLIACGSVLICTAGATVYACYRTLWEKPAFLLIPRPPKSGKRIFLEYIPPIWNRMKFTHKVTARNLIRQKKHFFMTVTGIAGCTALMVAGFGLRDSMIDIARTQFKDILQYDFKVELKEDATDRENQGFLPLLPRRLALHSEQGYIIKENERINIEMLVPQNPESLPNFIALRNRKTKRPLVFSDSQAILTEKIAEEFGLVPGDTFTLENAKGLRGSFTLSEVTENYVGVTAYLGPRAYADGFGEELSYRTIFAETGIEDPAGQDRLIASALAEDAVTSADFMSRTQASWDNLLNSISFVVAVLIFAAGGLAMIVLYNLTNININERTREIATLRVLGFRRSEAAAYLFREITVLSVFGALAGLGLGIPLHRFIIGVAENPDLMFGRNIAPASFALSGTITLVFSAGVNLFMLKKLNSIKMADSMKAAD